MKTRHATAAIPLLALFALPAPAFAHGFGERFDLPIPLWLYLYGAAAAVLLSFVVVGLFVGQEHAPHRYPRFNVLRINLLHAVLTRLV